MHVRDSDHEKRPRNTALVVLGLVALLAVVALASSGHVAVGTDATRRPGHELADTVLSLLVVVILLGGVGIFYVYYLQRTNAYEQDTRARRLVRNRRVLTFLVTLGLLLAALEVRAAIHHGKGHRSAVRSGALGSGAGGSTDRGYQPRFAPIPVAIVLGAAAIAALAAYHSHRARRRALGGGFEPTLELTLADVLGETLDDLRAEPDPRVAVIAAYARLERTFAAFGMPRRDADAPLEYLERVLVGLDGGEHHPSRLTQLFEHAKFSTRAVGPEMKTAAIELLETIRADLQVADAARQEARAQALHDARPTIGGTPA